MKTVAAIVLALIFSGCAASQTKTDSPAAVATPAAQAQAQPSEATSEPKAPNSESPKTTGPTIDKPPTFKKGFKLTFRSRKSDFDCTYEGEDDGLMVFHYDTREKL